MDLLIVKSDEVQSFSGSLYKQCACTQPLWVVALSCIAQSPPITSDGPHVVQPRSKVESVVSPTGLNISKIPKHYSLIRC